MKENSINKKGYGALRTVLVVQGDDETIELLRSYLEGALYKVVMASDG